jgi:hypothetical protein
VLDDDDGREEGSIFYYTFFFMTPREEMTDLHHPEITIGEPCCPSSCLYERERDIDAALYNNNNIAGIKGDNCCFALPLLSMTLDS